jgi:hypothetical protein
MAFMQLSYQQQNHRWYVVDVDGIEGYGRTREDAFTRYFLNRDEAWVLNTDGRVVRGLDASIA